MSRTPSIATAKSAALLAQTHDWSTLPVVSTHPGLRKGSCTGSHVTEEPTSPISGRQLSADVTGYQFSRHRSESLAFTECPLGRARRQPTVAMRFLNFAKRNSGDAARYKSTTSLANTVNGQLDHQPLSKHSLDLKAGRRQVGQNVASEEFKKIAKETQNRSHSNESLMFEMNWSIWE